MDDDSKVCSVCLKELWKYRCPTCRKKYCSVPCFKTHKMACHVTKATPEEDVVQPHPTKGEEKDKFVLSEAQVKLLSIRPEIRNALRDERLQSLIRQIDSAEDREKSLIFHCENDQDFAKFVDECLRTVNGEF